MRYDIVPIKSQYRGMDRTLLITDLWNSNSKKHFDELLEKYYLYLENCEVISKKAFEDVIIFFQEVIKYDILCEMIVYDTVPLDTAFGYPVELIGIDIVHDMCESLLSDTVSPQVLYRLNKNGLCRTVNDVGEIIPFLKHGAVEWNPCYVYRVKFEL